MKVLFFGKLPPPYIGPALVCKIIIDSKLKEKYELIHFDTSDHRNISTLGKIDIGNVFVAFKQYIRLLYVLLKHRPDLVYIPSQQTTIGYLRDLPFILFSKIFRTKIVCHLHGGYFKFWYNESNFLMKWIVRRIQRIIDAQIVLGNVLVSHFDFLMDKSKIFVMPNGLNVQLPDTIEKNKKFQALFLGNFVKSKGVIVFLNALKSLKGMNVKFVLAGSATHKETYNEIKSLIEANPDFEIDLRGVVIGDDKYKLYSESDVFVFPTYYRNEGHPLVIVEAMAAGLPVISTNRAAIPETVIDNVNGFIIEEHDSQAIAEKIKILIENPEMRKKMGQESRRLYEKNFTEEKMIEKLDVVFSTVLAKK